MKVPDEPVIFEKSVISKQRATKKCELCDITMLNSSHSKHTKSKAHLKKLSNNDHPNK